MLFFADHDPPPLFFRQDDIAHEQLPERALTNITKPKSTDHVQEATSVRTALSKKLRDKGKEQQVKAISKKESQWR